MPEKKEKWFHSKKSEPILVQQPITTVSETRNSILPDSHQWVSVCVYFKSLTRGSFSKHEVSDWLEAEKEYQSLMSGQWKSGLVRLS